MAKWKMWSQQGELKQLIRDWIDTGSYREKILADAKRECNGKWDDTEIAKAFEELLQDWLIINDGDGSINVTEWSHSALEKATGKDLYSSLEFLKEVGVFHPDMVQEGIEGVSGNTAEEAEAADASAMDVMPESSKVKKVAGGQSHDLLVKEVPEGAERVETEVDGVIQATFKDTKGEFTIAEVIEKASTVSSVDMAKEIGGWIIENVEQFIDNQDTIFRMYLNIRSDMGMPASSLY